MRTEDRYLHRKKFELEAGGVLEEVCIHYTTYGTLAPEKDNVVWVCHALTANSDPAEWWPGLVGKGRFFDPADYYIVCVNMLGSCYGSTGPLSLHPADEVPYHHRFPQVTNRDIVGTFEWVRQHLQIPKINYLIGASLGGQQALEWSIMHPEVVSNLILMATNAFHSPWGIAFNASQRAAIEGDITWELSTDTAGIAGMKIARSIALLSYRHYHTYGKTQAEKELDLLDEFRASSYQSYQGEKLARRFNAFSYWHLSKAMDSHNVGRGRGSVEEALSKITANALIVGITSDILFPPDEQRYLAAHIKGGHFAEIDSDYGHDGFLIENEKLVRVLDPFIKSPKNTFQ